MKWLLQQQTLMQEDFHCDVALRNYERAWCAPVWLNLTNDADAEENYIYI